jgi:uncharacterized membrane protein YtjA (UPF0391 family)
VATITFTPAWRALWVNGGTWPRGRTWFFTQEDTAMLHYALVFLVIAIIAAVLGFGGIAGAAAGIAKILFIVFLIFALIAFFRRAR